MEDWRIRDVCEGLAVAAGGELILLGSVLDGGLSEEGNTLLRMQRS